MSESARDLLVRGTAAARSGEEKEARFYLEWVLSIESSIDQKIDAWYWLSRVTQDRKEKRSHLENILANQPFHLLARRELMILDGKLDANDIIDPNRIPVKTENGERKAKIESFTCPNCGGRMVYTPDGTSLTCEYCESRRNNRKDSRGSKLSEQDFLLSMATARGHSQLTESISIECEACGIQFILAPETLSFTCPHCSSTYVVNDSNVKQTITPGGIVPAKVSKEAAKAIIRRWTLENHVSDTTKDVSLNGVYLPVWWFSFAGQVNYKYYVEDKNHNRNQMQAFQDSHPVLRENIMVPAEESYERQINWQIANTNPNAIVTYLPEYLADWAAETYQKSIADASLDARQVAFNLEKSEIRAILPMNAEDVSYDSHQMMVDSYKLILLPCWIGTISTLNGDIPYYLNGDDGNILVRQEKTEPKSLWDKLFG
jgi:predicted RNA-binding Zn-ribbon protein involved in translation (DUF1610 family)